MSVSVDRSGHESAGGRPPRDSAMVVPDSSPSASLACGVYGTLVSIRCFDGRARARHIVHDHFVLLAGLTSAALRTLRNQFRMKYALARHVFDHLRNRGGALADHDQIQIGNGAVAVRANLLYGNSRHPHTAGESGFQIGEQPRP